MKKSNIEKTTSGLFIFKTCLGVDNENLIEIINVCRLQHYASSDFNRLKPG